MSDVDLLQQVRLAWADVLAVDAVEGVPLDTNFLEAGGNSLLLVMLWEQLQDMTTHAVKLSDLFQYGTVRAQAALLAEDCAQRPAVAGPGEPAAGAGERGTSAADPARDPAGGQPPTPHGRPGTPDRGRLLSRASRGPLGPSRSAGGE